MCDSAIVCQQCFNVEADMQDDDGNYLCSNCGYENTFKPSEYLQRLRELSEVPHNIQSNVSFIKLLDYVEGLERERFIENSQL